MWDALPVMVSKHCREYNKNYFRGFTEEYIKRDIGLCVAKSLSTLSRGSVVYKTMGYHVCGKYFMEHSEVLLLRK